MPSLRYTNVRGTFGWLLNGAWPSGTATLVCSSTSWIHGSSPSRYSTNTTNCRHTCWDVDLCRLVFEDAHPARAIMRSSHSRVYSYNWYASTWRKFSVSWYVFDTLTALYKYPIIFFYIFWQCQFGNYRKKYVITCNWNCFYYLEFYWSCNKNGNWFQDLFVNVINFKMK